MPREVLSWPRRCASRCQQAVIWLWRLLPTWSTVIWVHPRRPKSWADRDQMWQSLTSGDLSSQTPLAYTHTKNKTFSRPSWTADRTPSGSLVAPWNMTDTTLRVQQPARLTNLLRMQQVKIQCGPSAALP
ncbi:uncharacterized protein B0H18DRAFT_114193 [Fomitopsis serialis]|uniref:uncharacterized protein n=1 Tax=Fomitopsis serialis TaxID=139415 RepID=UPI002007F4B4|nr:uncharacterized protein B0H18DRAFT_114193 [Neoantrodia serialis]KAH9914929.1 hypothetical protein B0H18DRAFT_114193 [Neoantrodia serialis]